MDGCKINVSGLLAVLHSALDGTDLTWRIIETSCRDVHNVLKKWELPADTCIEDQKPLECLCSKEQCDEPLELANDIEQLLVKAKETRKKVAEKNLQNKQLKLTFSNGVKSKAPLNLQLNKGTSVFQSRHVRSASSSSKYSTPSVKCIEDKKRPKSVPTCVTSKSYIGLKDKTPKLRKSLTPFQTTYQRDFIVLMNRKPVRLNRPLKVQENNNIKCEPERVDYMSIQGRNNVDIPTNDNIVHSLQKMNISNKANETSTAHVRQPCPVHDPVNQERSCKKSVSLHEAIDVLGVPSEILKPLKTYYQYMAQNSSNLSLGSSKSQTARMKFVENLTVVNVRSWKEIANDPVVDLWKEYISVLQSTYSIMDASESGDGSTVRDLMSKLDALESAFQRTAEFNTSPYNGLHVPNKTGLVSTVTRDDDTKEWALAGVWNKKCHSIFSGMKQIMNMRYRNKKQCQLFQQNLQKIQKLQLQMNILEVMINEILPQMNQIDHDSPIFIKLYKMCCALCDISSLSLPIFIRN